jgi:hypothetical protein
MIGVAIGIKHSRDRRVEPSIADKFDGARSGRPAVAAAHSIEGHALSCHRREEGR